MEANIKTARSKVNPDISLNAKINSENIGISNAEGYMMGDNSKFNVLGKTSYRFWTGKSDILYSTKAASDYSILGRVMSHETAHAYRYALNLPALNIEEAKRFHSSLNTVEHLVIRKLEYNYAYKNFIYPTYKNGYIYLDSIDDTFNALGPAEKFLYKVLHKAFSPIFNVNYIFP